MDVASGSTANGAKIIQWRSNGGANQQWTLTKVADGSTYMLAGVGSDLNIGVAGASTSQGAAVDQETGTGATSRQWRLS